MGVFGISIFGDDLALDVRDRYVSLLGDGLEGSAATQTILREFSSSANDPDDAPALWLALAMTQWNHGRPEPDTIHKAIDVIDNGSALSRWTPNSADYRKRERALAEARIKLTSPPKPPRRVKRRWVDTNEWDAGDLIAYQLTSGRSILFRVIGHHSDLGGKSPICELLHWVGDTIPSEPDLRLLPIWKSNSPAHPISRFILLRSSAKQRPDHRLTRLGIQLPPAQTRLPATGWFWKELDHLLKKDFDLE